ncbi:MAG: elongation factor P [Flavobacteriales bacterium]|nr:elongation factor P [Flavobacteriales bacterium]
MATTADIKNGMCIKFNHGLYSIVEFQHVKPGKGPAFVRTKLKNLTTGKILDNTFTAGHRIEPVRVERRKYQFLYSDENGYHFMNQEDYEQVYINENIIDAPKFLKEGEVVEIVFDAEQEIPLTCELPTYVELEITYTEPGIKGDTATNASKPAKVETGADVRVPLFIEQGDKIRLDPRTGSYSERVKN